MSSNQFILYIAVLCSNLSFAIHAPRDRNTDFSFLPEILSLKKNRPKFLMLIKSKPHGDKITASFYAVRVAPNTSLAAMP